MNSTNNVSGKPSGLSVNAKRWIYICISVVVLILIKNISFPASIVTIKDATLTAEGQKALAVLIFALLLWITEAIPFHFTGLLAMALLALLGVDSFGNIVKVGFGNINVVFFIGVLTSVHSSINQDLENDWSTYVCPLPEIVPNILY